MVQRTELDEEQKAGGRAAGGAAGRLGSLDLGLRARLAIGKIYARKIQFKIRE